MVSLPKEFTAIGYPGYFWDTKGFKLYSIKTGVLKELCLQKPNIYKFFRTGYNISHFGRRIFIAKERFVGLRPENSKIPVVR